VLYLESAPKINSGFNSLLPKKKALIICTHNSSRSQMSEGLLRHIYGMEYEVFSAGTHPSGVNPFAIQAMDLIGIDISGHSSDLIDRYLDQDIDIAVTVCDSAQESCPIFTDATKVVHNSFRDPSAVEGSDEEKLNAFVEVRNELEVWIREFFKPELV